eukprot:173080_1
MDWISNIHITIVSISITSAFHSSIQLLLFPDAWRFDWADDYFIHNLSIRTPIFDAIVANGTRFVHTIVASPLCAPSRSCIASGKEYDFCGVPSNSFNFPTHQIKTQFII